MKNKLTHNLGLKILALIFSIGLWFVVNSVTDPVTEKTLYNVPVEITNEDLITNEGKVYEILEGTDVVNVRIVGKQSVVSYITKDDIKAVADLSELTFMNTVSIKVSSVKNNADLEFTASVENLKLSIEDMKRVQLIINTSTSGEPAEGYVVGTVTPSQNVVNLSGPQSLIEQIDHVEAVVNIAGYATDINSSVELKLCDAQGNEIKSNSIKMNISAINVAVTILATKEVPLNFVVQGEPAEGYIVFDELNAEPETIKLAGRKNVLDAVSEINIVDSALKVDGLKESFATYVNIRKYLPAGTQFADSTYNGVVSIAVTIEPLVTQEFEVPVKNIAIGNIPEGFDATIQEFEGTGVEKYKISVSGVEEDIKKMNAKDIIGVIDMKLLAQEQELTEWHEGSYVGELTFNLPENVFANKQYSLTVILEDLNKQNEESLESVE